MKSKIVLLVFWVVFTAMFIGSSPPVIAVEKTVEELVANVIGPPSCTVINFGRHSEGAKKELVEIIENFNHMANEGKDPYEELMSEFGPHGFSCVPLIKSSLSGVIISESGRVLTLAHGIGPQADNVIFIAWAYAENGQRMLYQANILRVNMALDIAELQIKGAKIKFPYIVWGDSDEMKTGDNVFVVSSPLGLPFTFNQCEVAHIKRSKKMLKALFNYNAPCDMIQLSGSFLPGGSSGGPVFNRKGFLIGFIQSRIEREPASDSGASGGEEKRFTKSEPNINITFILPINEVKRWLGDVAN